MRNFNQTGCTDAETRFIDHPNSNVPEMIAYVLSGAGTHNLFLADPYPFSLNSSATINTFFGARS